MELFSQNKQNAISFVSRIPDFKRNLSLIDNFLSNLDENQLQRLKFFLGKTELLFLEQTLTGDYSCKTGILFNQLNVTDIPILINDIKNGKYDHYL